MAGTSVKLRVTVENPPHGVEYALQKGAGTKSENVQRQRSGPDAPDVHFEIPVEVVAAGGAAPDFRGPFVQGPKGGRFLYIAIGARAGQKDSCWERRLKVPLSASLSLLDVALGGILEARLPGTGSDGSPTCATVAPVGGWKRVAS